MIKLILGLLFLLLLVSILYFAGMAKGEKAIEKMDTEEKKYFEDKVMKIEIGSSYEEVKGILGAPNRGDGTRRPAWRVLGSKGDSQVAIYLSNTNTVFKIRWMKIGKFVWEKNIQ